MADISTNGGGQDASAVPIPDEARATAQGRNLAPSVDDTTVQHPLAQILESITDGILVFDAEWHFTYANDAGAKTLGYPAEALIGAHLWTMFPELAATNFGQMYQRAMVEQRVLELEDFYPPFNAWFAARAYPSPHALTLYFRDVTERKQIEMQLRASEERYRAFLRNSSEAVWCFEVEQPIVIDQPVAAQIEQMYQYGYLSECNSAMARMYGFERPEEMVGLRLAEIMPQAEAANVAYLHEFIRSGFRLTDVESVEVDKQGATKYILNNLIGTLEEGKLRRAWGTSRDITESKQTQAALRVSEERYRALVQATSSFVWTANEHGRGDDTTAWWHELTGQDHVIANGWGWLDALHPDDRAAARDMWTVALETQTPYDVVYRLCTRDGTYRTFAVRGVPLWNADGTFREWVGTFDDITAQREAEAERAQALAREREIRAAAELSAERMARLQAITAALAEVVTSNDVAEVVIGQCIAAMDAWAGSLVLKTEDLQTLEIVAAIGYAQPVVEGFRRLPINAPVPLADATREGRAIWLGSRAAVLAHYPVLADGKNVLQSDAIAALPLWREGQAAGALGLSFRAERAFTAADQEYMLSIAQQCGQALERVRLFEAMQRQAERQRQLKDAALAINAAMSLQQVLQIITEQARVVIGAHQSISSLSAHEGWAQSINAVSLSDKYAAWKDYEALPNGSGIYVQVSQSNQSYRMTQAELEAHPAWRGFGEHAADHPPMRGWLAAPFTGRDGRNIGLLQLSDKYAGEFSADDEAILVQLAQMASIALENARLFGEVQAAERVKAESLALLDTFLENAPIGLGFWDHTLRYQRVNEALAEINGLPRAAHLGRTITEVLPNIGLDVITDLQRVLDTAVPIINQEVQGETPAAPGVLRTWLASYYPVPGQGTQPIGVGAVVQEITERKHAEAQLRENEERTRLAVEIAQLGTWRYDLATNVVALDERMCRIWGEPPETILDLQTVLERVHPGDRARVTDAIGAALDPESLGRYDIDYRIVWADGTERWVTANGQAQFEGDGPNRRPIWFIGTCVDITERKRAEAQLRENEARYRTVFESIDEGLSVIEMLFDDAGTPVDYRFLEINPMFEQQTGLHNAVGKTARELVPGLEAHWFELYGKIALTGEPERFIQASEAMNRWFDVYAFRHGEENSRRVGILFKDITERKRNEAAQQFLLEASTVLSASLDYEATLRWLARLVVPHRADWCSIDMLERDGTIHRLTVAHVDPAKAMWAEELRRRYPPDPDAPRGVANVLRTGQSELVTHITNEMLVASISDAELLQIIRELGLRSSLVVPMVTGGQVIGVISLFTAESNRHFDESDRMVAEDLAHRAALAVENARLYREAQQAIEARDDFLSVASHELKTPLTSLQLQAQSLLRTTQKGSLTDMPIERLRHKFALIDQQASRLTRLANELLDVARIRAGQLEPHIEAVDVGAVIHEVAERFEEQLAQVKSALVLDIPQPLVILTDRSRLDQVLTNLLSNAIKYGPGHPIEIRAAADAHAIRITVRDQGIGIAPDDQARIWSRFERAVSSRNYGGLGLGLYIVRQIVEALGGRVEMFSALGAGATFTVTLPRANERPAE